MVYSDNILALRCDFKSVAYAPPFCLSAAVPALSAAATCCFCIYTLTWSLQLLVFCKSGTSMECARKTCSTAYSFLIPLLRVNARAEILKRNHSINAHAGVHSKQRNHSIKAHAPASTAAQLTANPVQYVGRPNWSKKSLSWRRRGQWHQYDANAVEVVVPKWDRLQLSHVSFACSQV